MKIILVVCSLSFSQMLYAGCVQTNNSLNGLVGLDDPAGTVYASTYSTLNQCSYSNVRFKAQNTDTKMALSILMSAKMSDMKVRIDLLDENDCNSAYIVYVQ